MLIQKALSKLRLRNGDDIFLMVEYEVNTKLSVKILNLKLNEIYVGHSNGIELRSQAARIRLTFNEFTEKIIKALIENASDDSNFLYCLDECDGVYKFQWKSIDQEQTIISLGSVDVRKENYVTTLTDMLEMISIEMHTMRNNIQELNADINKIKNQTSDALEQIRIAAKMKEKLEKELHSKFVLVLNEKKRKIRELQQKNKHNSDSGTAKFQKKSKKSFKPLVGSFSDETDELEDRDEPGPSTAKSDKSFLFLDDNSILPTNRNRIRNRKMFSSKQENGSRNKSAFMNSDQSNESATVDDDVNVDHLFDNL